MSKIIGRPLYAPAPAGGGKPSAPKFTYDGDYVIRDDGVVELLTSGTLMFLNPAVIDVFMVGGGGMGGYSAKTGGSKAHSVNGGGGGGYTRTVRRVNAQGTYKINIGEGSTTVSTDGGSSAWGSAFTVPGGTSAGRQSTESTSSARSGHLGGSGGGGAVINNSDYGTGGSDGSNGEQGFYASSIKGGAGQGFTTREFGEATGKLYAGGGGGGRAMQSTTPIVSPGGSGGGGAGGFQWYNTSSYQAAGAGGANTGGGGGGSVGSYRHDMTGGAGGSGIVCFREAQELPELAGTWVLNERLYAPESEFTESVSFTAGKTTGSEFSFTSINYNGQYLRFATTTYTIIYEFNTNNWSNKYKTLIFPTGATAPEEFRAWLASNATKQTA